MQWSGLITPFSIRVNPAEYGRSTSKGVNINRRKPQNWEAPGLFPLRMGGVPDPKKHAPPHMCYLAEHGRFALKGVGINTEPPKLGSAEAHHP